jgi:hypothetical protein
MPTTALAEPPARTRYAAAVRVIAAEIAAEIQESKLSAEAAWERAEAVLARHRKGGPHRWIFDGLEPFVSSSNVFEALETRPDGSRDWVHASLASAADAVVKFDVFQHLLDDPRLDVE